MDNTSDFNLQEPLTQTEYDTVVAKTPQELDNQKRREHEASEAKRKAEWEAKKKAREDETMMEWEKAIDVSENELYEISVKRLGDMTERLTRRNMKICVTEYIQTRCYESIKLAQHAMHPKKCMINCFKFINEKALEYLKEEQKNNGEKVIDPQVIGGDVPDELCYQWAEEYFMNLDAEIDKTEEDKDFVLTPYRSTVSAKTKKKEAPKKESSQKTPEAKLAKANTIQDSQIQLSFDIPEEYSEEAAA